jgi:hypothetical protein
MSAIKVAALATAKESLIGNQSISLPFIRLKLAELLDALKATVLGCFPQEDSTL